MKKYLGFIIILALLLALVPLAGVSAAATKVDVCHFDKDAGIYFLINISDNAFDSHVAHGDAAPGELVPGQEGFKFASDCSVIPVKELIATLNVPSTPAGPVVIYSPVLIDGQAYQFKASGLYKFAPWSPYPAGWADAKYSNRLATITPYIGGWVDGALLGTPYGLQVTLYDGNTTTPLAPVGWVEPYNDAHIYTAPYTGGGTSIGFFIWDSYYGDNSGSLTIEIWKIN